MRSLVLIAALGLLGAAPGTVWAQKAELARYQRAAQDPAAFHAAFQGKKPEEARVVGQQMASRGLIRLSAEDLRRRAELMLDFTDRAGTKACAKWSRGTATGDEVVTMIAKLDSVALDEWVDLSMHATLAEIRQAPAPHTGMPAGSAGSSTHLRWHSIPRSAIRRF
jgi:hypothetical protein